MIQKVPKNMNIFSLTGQKVDALDLGSPYKTARGSNYKEEHPYGLILAKNNFKDKAFNITKTRIQISEKHRPVFKRCQKSHYYTHGSKNCSQGWPTMKSDQTLVQINMYQRTMRLRKMSLNYLLSVTILKRFSIFKFICAVSSFNSWYMSRSFPSSCLTGIKC